jgi:5-hydroxyisourate hydrolase
MSAITTHVLDTSKGLPAADISVVLEFKTGEGWTELATGSTDSDGRIPNLLSKERKIDPGIYRLTFETRSYFARKRTTGFYPCVSVVFEIQDSEQHYHIPLLLSPFGYSTYRGS